MADDHAIGCLPLSERSSPLTLGLLWLTMVTGFPTVYAGFQWYAQGLSLSQTLVCLAISIAVTMAYALPACLLGAVSGQTFTVLSRAVFGRWGSWFVSALYLVIGMSWYSLAAVFMAQGLSGLLHLPVETPVLSFLFGLAMAFNNLFGFSGIANFARYIAAPILIGWVGYTFVKALSACPADVIWHATQSTSVSFNFALVTVSSIVVSYGTWGNEADYWRYSKPKTLAVCAPLLAALLIGQVIFPITGWLMSYLYGAQDYAGACALMNRYAFGGLSALSVFVLGITLFAVNDSALYGLVNAAKNIYSLPRRLAVCLLAICGALLAVPLSKCGNALDLIAQLSGAIMPAITVIIVAEHFVVARIFKIKADFEHVPPVESLPRLGWSAAVAFAVGLSVWSATCGFIPHLNFVQVGVPALAVWLSCFCTYLVMRALEVSALLSRKERLEEILLNSSPIMEATTEATIKSDYRSRD